MKKEPNSSPSPTSLKNYAYHSFKNDGTSRRRGVLMCVDIMFMFDLRRRGVRKICRRAPMLKACRDRLFKKLSRKGVTFMSLIELFSCH